MKKEPLVSIGIPTYNRVSLLKRSLQSITQQDYSNLEVVISDNASLDGTFHFCQQLSQKDSRIKYIRQPYNKPSIYNFQEVLLQATGELFMWFPDDYFLDPNYIRECVQEFQRISDLVLVAGYGKFFRDGKFSFYCADYNCLEDLPEERVVSFYKQFRSDLTAFYGLIKRAFIFDVFIKNKPENKKYRIDPTRHTRLETFEMSMGSDVRVFAELCFLGKVKTIYNTHVYRYESSSNSKSFQKFASAWSLPEFQGQHPYETHAVMSFADIGYRSSTYSSLSSLKRWMTAWKVLHYMSKMYRFNFQSIDFKNFYCKALDSENEYYSLLSSMQSTQLEILEWGIRILRDSNINKFTEIEIENFQQNLEIFRKILEWTKATKYPLKNEKFAQYKKYFYAIRAIRVIVASPELHSLQNLLLNECVNIGLRQSDCEEKDGNNKEALDTLYGLAKDLPTCKSIYIRIAKNLENQNKIVASERAMLISEQC